MASTFTPSTTVPNNTYALPITKSVHLDADTFLMKREFLKNADQTWEDDDFLSFLAHQTSDHHETAGRELGKYIESIRLEWVDPIVGASKFAPTNSQPIPEDADELTKHYAVRTAAQIADWWLPLRQ